MEALSIQCAPLEGREKAACFATATLVDEVGPGSPHRDAVEVGGGGGVDPDPVCGDGICSPGEELNCPFDCGQSGGCGPADGSIRQNFPTQPEGCLVGDLAPQDSVGAGGQFRWLCLGSGNGANASCSAQVSIVPACGTANNGALLAPPSGNAACAAGTQFNTDAGGDDGEYNWECSGSSDTTPVSCQAANANVPEEVPVPIPGICRSYPAARFQQSVSTTAGCQSGAYVDRANGANAFQWRCEGSGGAGGANCSSPTSPNTNNCGRSVEPSATAPGTGRCALLSTPGAVARVGDVWNWTCSRFVLFQGTVVSTCSVPAITPAINGACRAHGPSPTKPATNNNTGCTAGFFVDAASDPGAHRWRCVGDYGGTDADCQSPR